MDTEENETATNLTVGDYEYKSATPIEVGNLEVLMFLYKVQYQELQFRRERELKILAWSGAIFLGFAGALLFKKSGDSGYVLNDFGFWGKLFSSLFLALLGAFSVRWQNRERQLGYKNQKVMTKIHERLGCFDGLIFRTNGPRFETLLDPNLRNWGYESKGGIARMLRANLITITWLLSVFDIGLVWLVPG